MLGAGLELVVETFLPNDPAFRSDQTYKASINGSGTRALLTNYKWLIPVFVVYLLGLGCMYVLYMVGVLSLWQRGRIALAYILTTWPAYILLVSAHQGYYRYRLPLLPFLVAGMAVGICWLRQRRRLTKDQIKQH